MNRRALKEVLRFWLIIAAIIACCVLLAVGIAYDIRVAFVFGGAAVVVVFCVSSWSTYHDSIESQKAELDDDDLDYPQANPKP